MSEKQRDPGQLLRQKVFGRAFLKVGRKNHDPLLISVGQPLIAGASEGKAMSENEGTLRMMATGRWAIVRPGREPVEITSGELFRVEVAGVKGLQLTRMEYRHLPGGDGAYYSVDGYPLRDGLCAAIGEQD